jgi:nucleotide-binding universal stress UspA family protein
MSEREIVVGFDGSPMSAAALRWAAEQCRMTGARLRAVHTWEAPSAEEYAAGAELRHVTGQAARQDADRWVAAAIGPQPDALSVQVDVIEGPAGPVLVEYSRTAVMLVVGTREHTGVRRLVGGSVSHYCLSHATCPVVAVPGPVAEPMRSPGRGEAAVLPGPLF